MRCPENAFFAHTCERMNRNDCDRAVAVVTDFREDFVDHGDRDDFQRSTLRLRNSERFDRQTSIRNIDQRGRKREMKLNSTGLRYWMKPGISLGKRNELNHPAK